MSYTVVGVATSLKRIQVSNFQFWRRQRQRLGICYYFITSLIQNLQFDLMD